MLGARLVSTGRQPNSGHWKNLIKQLWEFDWRSNWTWTMEWYFILRKRNFFINNNHSLSHMRGNHRTASLGSTYSREYQYFCDHGYTIPNPRHLLLQHLETEMKNCNGRDMPSSLCWTRIQTLLILFCTNDRIMCTKRPEQQESSSINEYWIKTLKNWLCFWLSDHDNKNDPIGHHVVLRRTKIRSRRAFCRFWDLGTSKFYVCPTNIEYSK